MIHTVAYRTKVLRKIELADKGDLRAYRVGCGCYWCYKARDFVYLMRRPVKPRNWKNYRRHQYREVA